jgi:ATP-dependent helicase Lhr and Lhr-like helicase
MSLERFHPAVAAWFETEFKQPTEPQARAWPAIKDGRNTLIAAPTGSGKTLSAFLAAIDDLVRQGIEGTLEDTTQVVYVSPLKALSNDIQRNLEQPLAGIQAKLREMGLPEVEIRTLVRTGDTSASERARMIRRPPHIAVTTPESLYLLLTSEGGRRMLRNARTLIVDEIHALVRDKRGSHLALSIERLQALVGRPLIRIGLSATQRPIEDVASFLFGAASTDTDHAVIDVGHTRKIDLAIELPRSPLEAVMSAEVWNEVYDRLAELINEHQTTLVFVNTRRMAERVARYLGERIGDSNITSHHGSLSRERRFEAEQQLKAGKLKALVATASLELGIDIGSVNLVCQIGSTRAIATLLQRVGRSGHSIYGLPKGRIFPSSRDELIECVALLDAHRRGDLDRVLIPEKPLDILAQQIVATVACEEWTEDNLFELVTKAYPYRNLTRKEFDEVVLMLANGFATQRGRRSAYLHHDAVNHKFRARRGARLTALTSGGAIPDNADYDVILDPDQVFIGTVNEDFAVESLAGDIFQLGNTSWLITRVERGRVRVADAAGQPPTIPFWLGEAPSRTDELSIAVSRVRGEIDTRLAENRDRASQWIAEEVGAGVHASEQIVDYLEQARLALGVMPTRETLVLERFFDESGGTQLVIHSPFGSRLNRAWGLALRKRFCRKFNFELQAAATEDAIVLSLSASHSFPLADVFDYLRSATVRDLLIQALLDAPMFTTRWRWNANRALAIVRRRGSRRVPPQLQRMEAEDLLAAVFPEQVACGENIVGDREIPDHPLVNQTIRDCLVEAMDIDGLEALLMAMEKNEKTLVARELTEPSPLAQEILNARPYAYLDDAPLEERRTQAVMNRRWLDPQTAGDLGALDQAAIDRVREEAWPQPENADELHDALLQLGLMTVAEARNPDTPDVENWFEDLVGARRAMRLHTAGREFLVPVERLPHLLGVYQNVVLVPDAGIDARFLAPSPRDEALMELVRGRLESLGPVTVREMSDAIAVDSADVSVAFAALESEGSIIQGRFTPGASEIEWCDRRLLARIHRYTINRLRQEIEPVSQTDFMRFLMSWQRVAPGTNLEGAESLAAIVEQLEGFEAAAGAWETEILASRLAEYQPEWLDSLCLSGRVVWARISPPRSIGAAPIRSTPIALLQRKNASAWDRVFPHPALPELSSSGQMVLDHLRSQGASFFADLTDATGLLASQLEGALAELVACGLITADSFIGLRALLTPSNKRTIARQSRLSTSLVGMQNAGRWSRLPRRESGLPEKVEKVESEVVEKIARVLLNRYGVLFRRLLDREGLGLPWRDLLRVLRRLEARGEIRGGRFCAGFSGEQFALNEAVATMRSIRKAEPDGALVSICAADPLNLVGIVVPGKRVPIIPSNRLLFRDGIPVAVFEAGQANFLVEFDKTEQWKVRTALVRRPIPPRLRAYLGRSA